MTAILYAAIKRSDYENFYATCPHCGYENIFNRRSDLGTLEPISLKLVRCINDECGREFYINGDIANSAHEMLIYDCYDLFKNKKYSSCISNLAQACEVFYGTYIYVTLAYKPFSLVRNDLSQVNDMLELIYKKIEKFAFAKMQNVFVNMLINNTHPSSLDEAESIACNIDSLASTPSKNSIQMIDNEVARGLVNDLMTSQLSTLRNKVVHKFAYRPTEGETKYALEETRRIIFALTRQLEVFSDDINSYVH